MPSTLPQLTILSPGLIGGSIARAAKARGAAERIVLWARRSESRQALAASGLADAVAATPEEAVRGASLVVLAAPVDIIPVLARQIAPHLAAGAIVTDVGSVKSAIARQGRDALAGRGHFVGAHPMAGSEKTGWENGKADLFAGRTCFVTPLPETDKAAVAAVADFWSRLGAKVVPASPEQHDRIVAHVSHLPQALASSLCSFLAGQDPAWASHAGGGLRDTTRIAASDPELWRSILNDNRKEVLAALRGFQGELARLEKALGEGDGEAVAALIARGRDYRARLS